VGQSRLVLGVVEGFYGEAWSWKERHASLGFLASRGFSHYLYAPKADRSLRRDWRQAPLPSSVQRLEDFAAACQAGGLHFGIGLSPLGLHETWDQQGRADLRARLRSLAALKIDQLAILFDDMPGSFPDLARTQAEILSFVADCGVCPQLQMCPTYYSDAAILDKVFGERPPKYLEDLGEALDPGVDVFWTGPEICSPSYSQEHLAAVRGKLGRRPVLWDNYPVNDGPRMCRRLHLGAPDRPFGLQEEAAGIFMNPMNQPHLSRVTLDAVGDSLQSHTEITNRSQATAEALHRVFPATLAELLVRDWRQFGAEGLDGISPAASIRLVEEYTAIDHPAAAEVVHWLQGHSVVSADILTDS
jgi:hyaluronoglucosaminidase